MKHRLRWIGEASESGSVEVEFTEGLTIERTGGLTCTAGSGDTYFVGSGFRMPEQGARTVEWRVRMTRDDTTNPIDACGFALLDSTRVKYSYPTTGIAMANCMKENRPDPMDARRAGS